MRQAIEMSRAMQNKAMSETSGKEELTLVESSGKEEGEITLVHGEQHVGNTKSCCIVESARCHGYFR